MEPKTRISAEDGRQDLLITREFDLPLTLLFTAYTDPEIIEQWMSTRVLKLENQKHGSWQFETTNVQGHVVFRAGGVIHEFIPDQKITRTFEIESAPFGPQLEFLEFESLSADTSRLRLHIIYRSVAQRNQQLQLPFAKGLNQAHNLLQDIASKLK